MVIVLATAKVSGEQLELFIRTKRSYEWVERAKGIMPGGVTANVKAFPPYPIIMKRASGAYLTDLDGNTYIDYLLGYGALLVGHGHPKIKESLFRQMEADGTNLFGTPHEGEYGLGKRIQSHYPSMELLRYTNSGTEGTLLALRLACAFTGKRKIAKFEGHYHGGYDQVLFSINPDGAAAGPPEAPQAVPESKGIDPHYMKNIVILPFNDLEATESILRNHQDEIAAVIMEPFLGGFIPATPTFMEGLRRVTEELGIILIFDEVKTGFRLNIGGAQALYGIRPDLTVLGKVIGGGFPIGIVGGKKEIMMESAPGSASDLFDMSHRKTSAPREVLFHSGTYNGHPSILAVAQTVLDILEAELDPLIQRTKQLKRGLEELFKQRGIPMQALGEGTSFNVLLTERKVEDYRDLQDTDFSLRKRIDYFLLSEGIYTKPLNRYNLSVAHGKEELERTWEAYRRVLFKRI